VAVTAYPVVKVDAATGSDSLASGAGPATALTGTNASTDTGTGATMKVTLDGSPDLSGVATDGSHVIYLVDATAGHRNFAAINAADNAAKTVTVEQAFTISLTGKSWAIGGKRASVDGANSRKLRDNNGGSGDAMPGWAIEMASGHSENVAAQLEFRRGGDSTGGALTLRGAAGAATLPLLTLTGGTILLVPRSTGWVFRDFEMRSTVGGSAIWSGAAVGILYIGLRCDHATNKFTDGFYLSEGSTVRDSRIGNVTNDGVRLSANGSAALWNTVYSCGGKGVDVGADNLAGSVTGNVISGNTSHGVAIAGTSGIGNRRTVIAHNVIRANGGDGIRNTSTGAAAFATQLINNVFSSNGGYGLNFTGAGVTAAFLLYQGAVIVGNDSYSNTSGPCNLAGVLEGDAGLDPQYTDAAGLDFSVGTNLKAQGWPTIAVGRSATRSYVDPGAAQRQEPAGGSAGLRINPGLSGGLRG
jgi:hypothetical protein